MMDVPTDKQNGICEKAVLLGSRLGIKIMALIIQAVECLHWQVVPWDEGESKTLIGIFSQCKDRRNDQPSNTYA